MAENERPLIVIDNPPHIDFATIKKRRTIAKNDKLQSPMASDGNYNAGRVATGDDRLSVLVDTARMQLISPPPEEMLRKNPRPGVQFTPSLLANPGTPPVNPSTHGRTAAAKRKSASASSSPLTPNPKPRKQGRLLSPYESPTRTSFVHLGSSPDPNDGNSKQHTSSMSKTKRALVQSPHAKNPDADFIDDMPLPALVLPEALSTGSTLRRTLLGARSSRRSATPIPPYEPPKDVFTPPREVFLTPVPKSMSKSSKRKTITLASGCKSVKGKRRGSLLTIVTAVKQELPDIDLSLPMPPPSPTDDPLLLLGPPELEFDPKPTPPRRREMSVQAQAEQESGVWNENAVVGTSTDDSMMRVDPDDTGISPLKLFDSNDLPPSSNGGWSDSGDEGGQELTGGVDGEEGEGQYTGHWKMMVVRTKQDPPSSATRGRMEEWGRPISPFPKKMARLSFLEEEEEGEDREVHHQQVGSEQEEEYMGREEEEREEEVRRMSVEPEQNRTEPIIPHDVQRSPRGLVTEIQQQQEENDEEEQEVRQMSVEFDDDEEHVSPFENIDLGSLQFTQNPACGSQTVSIPASPPFRQPSPSSSMEVVVFPSIESSPETVLSSHPIELEHEITPAAIENHRTQSIILEQGEDDDQSSDGDELSLVKITSADPRAAARAAAILKQHDYDCYTSIEVKRRHLEAKERRNSHSDIEDFAKESRRRDVSGSGVAKASDSHRRRSTLSMGVIGDRVFIPGSPAITLPELLQEAELEVVDSPQSLGRKSLILAGRGGGDPFKTPIAAKYRAQTANTWTADRKVELYGVEREWTKEDWKYLDACFTDQRLEVGSRLAGAEQNPLAPVDIVSIHDVVNRFVASKGGFETVTKLGELWSRENLLERTRALQRKQRSGHIASPTTPCTPLSVGSSNVLGGKERAPRMQVPDFTPLGRRAAPPRKSRPTLQQSVMHDVASKNPTPEQEGPVIPPTLLAPRYSHLLEEAINISQQGSILPLGQETQGSLESEIEDTSYSYDVPSTTMGNRVKGFLFSYLPTLPKSSSTAKKAPKPLQPSLPIPPIDILSKPRGPIVTPARAPLSKPKHPKELVVLNPAPQPSTISRLPRMIKPRRLVELHPPPPPIVEPTPPIPRPRRSSGNSVKDLVRGFEEMQALSSHDKLKRTKSKEGWKGLTDKRPRWRP